MVYGVRFPTCGGFTLISPQPFACLGSQPFVLCLENLRTFEGLELLTFQLPQESFKKSVPISRFFGVRQRINDILLPHTKRGFISGFATRLKRTNFGPGETP